MTLRELFRLSHCEFTAYRTRSRATVITVGALFGLLLAVLVIFQGLENTVLSYAKYPTGGEIYLASSYERQAVLLERINKYGGEIVTLSDEQLEALGEELPASMIVTRFAQLSEAYNYASKEDYAELGYNPREYVVAELFSNQVRVYGYFREKRRTFVRPSCLVLLATSAFILAFTMAHLIAGSTKTFMLYRSIGASKRQLLLVYFGYLLELCARAALFAVVLALVLAGIVTAVGWNYFLAQLAEVYPAVPQFWPVLIGVNWSCAGVLCCMFLAAPLSFLLCLDQFSNKKIAQKLKGD